MVQQSGVNEWCEQSGYTVSGSTVTLTLDTDVQPGDETQVSYVSSTATLKDVDEDPVSITNSTVATYAFDDEPTLTSAKVTGTNTVTLEFSEELVGGSTNAFAVSTNGVSNTVSGYGEWINGDVDVGYGCAAW